MALDEPRDGDTVHQEHGIDWLLSPRDVDFVSDIGVHVDHVKNLWGAGFYVAPVSPHRGGC